MSGDKDAAKSFVISGKGFTKYYGIQSEDAVRRPAVMDPESHILFIELAGEKNAAPKVTTSRSASARLIV